MFFSAIEDASRYNPDLDPDVWMFQMILIERHCAHATAAIATMTSISDKSQPPAMWQVVRNLAIDIKPDIRGFCRQTSPAKTSEPQSFDEWALYLNLGSEYHDEYPTTVGFKIHNVRDTLEVRHRTLLDSVIANLDEAHTALHEAFQAGNAGQIDEWTNQIARIDRHCAEATATIATLVAARE